MTYGDNKIGNLDTICPSMGNTLIGTKLDFVRDITSDTHIIPKFSISRDSSKYG